MFSKYMEGFSVFLTENCFIFEKGLVVALCVCVWSFFLVTVFSVCSVCASSCIPLDAKEC